MQTHGRADCEIMIPAYRADHDLCAEAFIAGTADGWTAAPLSAEGKASRFRGHVWSVGECMFTDVQLGAFAFKVEERHFQNQGPYALFERTITGTTYGVNGGEDYRLAQDSIHLNGQRKARDLITKSIRVQEAVIPKAALGLQVGEAIKDQMLWPRSSTVRLLFAEWTSLYHGLVRGEKLVAKSALDRLISLLKIALGADPEREDVRAQARDALRRQICRFIEQHLSSPALSVEMLLHKFGVSRASLFRMFSEFGGVRAYIMERRTFRAVLDIWNADGARGSIQAASERYGFSSAPNFNRAVKRLLGDVPSALFQVEPARLQNAFIQDDLMRQQVRRRWASSVDQIEPLAI